MSGHTLSPEHGTILQGRMASGRMKPSLSRKKSRIMGKTTGGIMQEVIDRLTELEIRYTHQLRLVEELNDVVTECNQRIALLEQDNRRLREMLEALAPESTESPDE
jgi:SlyX protein